MKKILALLACLCMPLLAQEASYPLWVGAQMEWLTIADQGTANLGLRLGYQPIPYVSVGLSVATIASDIRHQVDSSSAAVGYRSIGIFAEPRFFAAKKVHLLLPVTVSAANLRSVVEGDSTSRSNGWFASYDAGVYGEMDFGSHISAALGGGIRISSGVDIFGLDNEDIRTYRLGVLLKWRG